MINCVRESITDFLKLESAGGILLLAAMVLGLLCANSPVSELYNTLLHMPIAFSIGGLGIDKPALLWINDGLMAIFFFLISLELKREVIEGELSSFRQVSLPAAAAVGGMILPEAMGWKALYGISILCGIGFTMSLFIGSLAFVPSGMGQTTDERIGIFAGSLLSAVFGYILLGSALTRTSGVK
jgi:Na+/H+ antiporter NhaA